MKTLLDKSTAILDYKPNREYPYTARIWNLSDYKITVTDNEIILESETKGNYTFLISDYMKTWRLR